MIRVALVGAGYIGPIHLNALSRIGGVKVATVIDVNAQFAEQAASKFNVERWGTDFREAIRDPGIDVVHNCTPNKYHFEITKEALLAGKSVLSEKPLSMTLHEAEELVELAEKKRAVNAIDFCYRYYPVVQEMAARMRRGDAGTVRMVTGSYFQDWLSREIDWTWRLLKAESGESNISADLGSHWFDLIQFVTGLRVQSVMSDLATLIPVRKRPTRQVVAFEKVDDVETEEVTVELEEYSATLFRLSNGAPGTFTTSQVCSGRKSDTEFQIYGSDCSYAWNHRESNRMWIGHRDRPNEEFIENPTLQDPSTARYATLPAGHPLGYHDAVLNLFTDFYESIASGKPSARRLPDFKTGLDEMRILEAVLESNSNRSWVEVKE
jgi:predicted dehydrogenase